MKISRFLSLIESALVVVLLSVMILLAFLQVILRNFFSSGLLWADPFLRHLVLWVGFLGASLATQKEKHINLDILTRYLSPARANIVRAGTNLFAALVTGFLARAGWTFLQGEMTSAEPLFTIGGTDVPAWYFQLIIPIGFALMAFRFGARSFEHLLDFFRGSPPSAGPPSTYVPTV